MENISVKNDSTNSLKTDVHFINIFDVIISVRLKVKTKTFSIFTLN